MGKTSKNGPPLKEKKKKTTKTKTKAKTKTPEKWKKAGAAAAAEREQGASSRPWESAEALAARFPYATDYADHFETPRRAYADLAPVLRELRAEPRDLAVYDPYYCDGAAERHLKSLGFAKARNPRGEDFYATALYRAFAMSEAPGAAASELTAFRAEAKVALDCFVTNPPYSGDHKEKALAFAMASGRPWCLLLPAYVAEKAYFAHLAQRHGAGTKPFFVVPATRYDFNHPHGAGRDHSHFESIWFCDGGEPRRTEALHRRCCATYGTSPGGPSVHRDLAALQAAKTVRTAKRPNPKKRKKLKAALAKAAAVPEL